MDDQKPVSAEPATPRSRRCIRVPLFLHPWHLQESLQATLPSYKKLVHVGDRVIDKHSKRTGICMYVGPAEFAKGKEVCGLRLDKKRSTTDCDGKYRGERYFRCTPGHGLYIPLEDAEYQGPGGDDDFAHMQNANEGRRGSGADGPPKGKQLALVQVSLRVSDQLEEVSPRDFSMRLS